MKNLRVPALLTVVAVLFFAAAAAAQGPQKPLTHDVYDSWKSISSSEISPDGAWVLYIEAPQDGDGRLIVTHPETGKIYEQLIGYTGEGTDAERAARPAFSYDSRYAVFMISPDKEAVDASKKDKKKKKLYKQLGIMDLADGSITVIDSVKSFSLPDEAGGWLAYLKEAVEKPKNGNGKDKEAEEAVEKKEEKKKEEIPEKSEEEKKQEEKRKKREDDRKEGTRLVLRNLDSGVETLQECVTSYRFTKNGNHLFSIVLTKDTLKTDGIFDLTPGESVAKPLLTGKGDYKQWAMNEDETMLSFVTNRDDYDADEPTFNLYGLKVGDDEAELWVSHTTTRGFPQGLSVSDKEGLSFSDDGSVVMFSIKDIPDVKDDEEDDAEKAKFDLWHWQDPYPQPQQKLMAKRMRDNGWEAVYHIKRKKFVQLGGEDLPDLSLNRHGTVAFANNEWPYAKMASYFGSFNDVWAVNTKTGERTLVKKKLFGGARLSPNGMYVVWFEGRDWFIHDLKSGKTRNVTQGLGVRFDQEDHDRPEPASPYGMAGWTDGDKAVLFYDRYDIWEISPDGKTRRMITEGYGRKNDLSFRYVNLDRDKYTVDPKAPMLLSTTNEETMDSGFYRDMVTGSAPPQKLIMADKGYGRVRKADEADEYLFTRQAFDEYPDLWISDVDFTAPERITDLGSQMDPYIWGHAELIDFESSDGKPLKGIFIKPDNFDPAKKYPLMVYIYETLHQGLHRYRNPSPGSSINPSYYVSNGYLLWMPDIEYGTGYPGQDALKCVLPGIQLLVNRGFVDEDAIGIQGHSWGGYQIAYMITQTNIFAAVEAGAPVSNMTSAYGGIRWGSGMVREFQYEKTQSRLGASLWEVPFRYIENSPLFWADKVETPIMMMHNDKDGAVPWYQGIEYMMALRRLGKEAYMFNYNGEDHGLRKRVNQKDWTIRLAEFFDHYLKGAPMPDWMQHGIKAWEQEE